MMNKDWYEKGLERFMAESAELLGVALPTFESVYWHLSAEGFIDYDVEKDVLWDRYYGEEEDGLPE